MTMTFIRKLTGNVDPIEPEYESAPVHPAPLVGVNLDQMVHTLQTSLDGATKRAHSIKIERARLAVEEANTETAIRALTAALTLVKASVETKPASKSIAESDMDNRLADEIDAALKREDALKYAAKDAGFDIK